MVDALSYFFSSHCFTTGVTKGLFAEMVHIKEPLLLIRKGISCSFLSRCLSGPFPYNSKYKVLSSSLNKTFPSFLKVISSDAEFFSLGFVFFSHHFSFVPTSEPRMVYQRSWYVLS